MGNFCKLFQITPEDQVLIMTGYDSNVDKYYLRITTESLSFRIVADISTDSKENIIRLFNHFDHEDAVKARAALQGQFINSKKKTDD